MSGENSNKLSHFVVSKKKKCIIPFRLRPKHEEFKKAVRAFKVKDEFGMENGTQPPICWTMYAGTVIFAVSIFMM